MRTDLIKTAVVFLAFIAGGALAQNQSKVTLSGDIPAGGIRLVNRPGTFFIPDSLAADSARIVSYYHNQGWLDCRLSVSSTSKKGLTIIKYRLFKGERYRLAFAPIIGCPDDSIATASKSIVDFYANQFASSATIEKIADDILRLCARAGYPYCAVIPGGFRKKAGSILEISIVINPGPRVLVKRVEFDGTRNINPGFLSYYSGLRIPFVYSIDLMNSIVWRLNRAHFLKGVGSPKLRYIDIPENGIVYIPIMEMPPVILNGALGYSSGDKSFYGIFNGAVSNILGGGRQFTFSVSRKDKVSRKLRFNYIEPLFLRRPLALELTAYQDDRDSLYIETGGQAGITITSSISFEYGLALGISRIAPESYGRSIIPNKKRQLISFHFVSDTRDNSANPLNGDYLRLEASFFNEISRGDSMFSSSSKVYRTAAIDYQKSIAVGLSSSIYGGVYARGDFSGLNSADRQFAVGGFGSLRGYGQDIFYVMRAAIFTVEYRLLTGREGRAYIFADMGFLQKGLVSKKIENKNGFGIGILAPTRSGAATIELAAPSDEGVSAIKLHFGFKAGF